MESSNILIWILLIFMILAVVVIIYDATILSPDHNKQRDLACQRKGYVEAFSTTDFDFCRAGNGDLSYVEFDCDEEFWPPTRCIANEIKVGEVWGIKE